MEEPAERKESKIPQQGQKHYGTKHKHGISSKNTASSMLERRSGQEPQENDCNKDEMLDRAHDVMRVTLEEVADSQFLDPDPASNKGGEKRMYLPADVLSTPQ